MKPVAISIAQIYKIVLEKLAAFWRVFKNPQLEPFLSQWNLIHTTTFASNIHLPSRSRFRQWSFQPI